jgi:hypothetical protein
LVIRPALSHDIGQDVYRGLSDAAVKDLANQGLSTGSRLAGVSERIAQLLLGIQQTGNGQQISRKPSDA